MKRKQPRDPPRKKLKFFFSKRCKQMLSPTPPSLPQHLKVLLGKSNKQWALARSRNTSRLSKELRRFLRVNGHKTCQRQLAAEGKKPSQVSTNRDGGYQAHQLIRGGEGGEEEKREGEVLDQGQENKVEEEEEDEVMVDRNSERKEGRR